MDNVIRSIQEINHYLRINDIANWIIFGFTAIMWPVVIFIWQKKKVNGIKGLEVRLFPGEINIDNIKTPSVNIEFINHTQKVVYVTNAYVNNNTDLFNIPSIARKNIGDNSYHLNFATGNALSGFNFNKREVTIQTNFSEITCIAIQKEMVSDFYNYKPIFIRKIFRYPKYFKLEYVAMVGDKKYTVSTIY